MADDSTSGRNAITISSTYWGDGAIQGEKTDANMDVDTRVVTETRKGFRHNALVLVVYPWSTGVIMEPDLSNTFERNHYAFVGFILLELCSSILPSFQVFSRTLQEFDATLASSSPTHTYLRSAMRDVACDRYRDKTTAQIISAETQDLHKSVGHASEVCSFLTACRLMDIIYMLDHPDDALSAPSHPALPANFSSFKVSLVSSVFFYLLTSSPGLHTFTELDIHCAELQQGF
jgi:hypothetical protein